MKLPIRLTLPQFLLSGLGFLPITCLSISVFGLISLNTSLKFILPPAFVLVLIVARANREMGNRALAGLLAGVMATGVYDCVRLYMSLLGVWGDFIPNIGRLALLDASANPFWGYLWRYLGNGGSMGMAFAVLPLYGSRKGMLYGLFVCGCLFATLLLAPHAQEKLFHLTPLTAFGAILGHLVYGSILGGITSLWLQKLRNQTMELSWDSIRHFVRRKPRFSQEKDLDEAEIGVVDHYYHYHHSHLACLSLKGPLEIGDQLHFKGYTTDLEEVVTALKVENREVRRADAGSHVVIFMQHKVRPQDRVYLMHGNIELPDEKRRISQIAS